MRAARLHARQDVHIEQLPDPQAGPGQVLVRVRAVAICPSDWRLWESGDAGDAPLQAPIIQGHEFSGDVVALGEGVDAGLLGARVAVEPSWHCGRCDLCRRGLFNICRHVIFPSFPPRDGALAELIACPAVNVCRLPESLSYEEGALVEPLGVSVHALRLAPPAAGEPVLILGAGVIGLCVLQLARLRGCGEVTVVEPVGGRRELAARFGAQRVVASHQDLLRERFEAPVVYECSGFSGAVRQSLELASPGGKAVVVGIPHPERVEFDANLPRRKELTMLFTRRSRDSLPEAIELVASGQVNLRALPVRRFSLEQTAAAIAATGERPGDMLRAIVLP